MLYSEESCSTAMIVWHSRCTPCGSLGCADCSSGLSWFAMQLDPVMLLR